MINDYDVYTLSRAEKRFFILILVVICTTIGYLFYQSVLLAFFLPFVYKRLEPLYCKQLADKRRKQLRLQFKDFLYSISSSFATGRHLTEALEEAETSLGDIYGENTYILREIEEMLLRIRKLGETDLQVMESFSSRSKLEDIEDFTEVFRACRDTGGDLIKGVNTAAGIIGEKIIIEAEIETMVSQKKLEGRIITLMPMGIILFLRLMSPDYLQVMYDTAMGRILMTVAIGATVVAYLLIERITDIEV